MVSLLRLEITADQSRSMLNVSKGVNRVAPLKSSVTELLAGNLASVSPPLLSIS